MELVFAGKECKYGQLPIKHGGPFVPLDSILESITACRVLHGRGTVKDVPSVSFSMPYFFQKERDRPQPELYNGTVGRGYEAILILYSGSHFSVCVCDALEQGFFPWGQGTPRLEFLDFV